MVIVFLYLYEQKVYLQWGNGCEKTVWCWNNIDGWMDGWREGGREGGRELLSMFSRLYDCMSVISINLRVSADWQFAFPYIKFAWELTFSIPVFPVISTDKLLSLSIPSYFTILCDFNIANTMSNSLAVFIFLHLDQK